MSAAKKDRIARRFAALGNEDRAGLITFLTANDPDHETSRRLICGLPAAGADLIEIGMPFSDPMADGVAIQLSSQRALRAGANMHATLDLVRALRATDDDTPVILMGYYNPIYRYGVDAFIQDALNAGVDGLIIVDLPPEENGELCLPAIKAGLHFIHLATPTTDNERLPVVLNHTSGFIYYVSITGITGTATAGDAAITAAVDRLRRHTDLPVAVGFGITTPAQAAAVARRGDAAVVGSALVRRITDHLDDNGRPLPGLEKAVYDLVEDLSAAVRGARIQSAPRSSIPGSPFPRHAS